MSRMLRTLGMLALLCQPACVVWAEAMEEMPMPMAPPVIPTSLLMLVILGLTLDVLLLVAVAYLWMMWRQEHQAIRQLAGLSSELRELAKVLEGMKQPVKEEIEEIPLPKRAEPEPPVKKEVIWKAFVEEFNQFSGGMKKSGASEACEKFVKEKKIVLLMCLDHAAEVDGQPAPKFAEVQSVSVSGFWAYPLPGVADRYAVVPNPSIPYEQKIHEEGGMKETFASNFESGVCRSIAVKMPALFHNVGGNWIIDQPGMIHVEP